MFRKIKFQLTPSPDIPIFSLMRPADSLGITALVILRLPVILNLFLLVKQNHWCSNWSLFSSERRAFILMFALVIEGYLECGQTLLSERLNKISKRIPKIRLV